MAITDLQLSEELQTGAPSIKYRGNEGPQAPMQMADADPLLVEEYEKYVFEMQEQGLQPMSFEEFRRQAMAGYAYGGIAGLDGRRRYGFGSKLKKFVRNVIPNEVADIAVKAAPFVAPFNPIAGGLMAGIGGFDQHGSIGRGLKSGLLTYGGGQLARGIGGGWDNLQKGFDPRTGMDKMGSGCKKYFISPIQDTGGVGKLWADRKGPGTTLVDKEEITSKLMDADPFFEPGIDKTTQLIEKGKPSAFKLLDKYAVPILLGSMGLAAATATQEDVQDAVRVSRGTGLDIDAIRAEVQEALAGGEAAWAELQKKYPYVGEFPTKKAAEGGIMRAGYYAGGQSIPSEYTMEDARKTAMQDKLGGITEVMKQADLYRQGDVGQMYMAEGGSTQEGGIMDLGGMEKDYRETGGFVDLGAEEKADDVPARLSVNEFVMTADAVRGAGDGDIDKGAERMEDLMEKLESKGKKENMKMAGGGARGWKAQMRAMEIAEEEYGRDFYDLNDALQNKIYNRALQEIDDMLIGRKGASDMFEVSERLSEVV